MIAAIACIAAALAALPALVRLWRGPTSHDRVAAGYLLMTIAAVALAAVGVTAGSDAILVAAILGALAQNVVFVAVLKAARRRSFQPALAALRRRQAQP